MKKSVHSRAMTVRYSNSGFKEWIKIINRLVLRISAVFRISKLFSCSFASDNCPLLIVVRRLLGVKYIEYEGVILLESELYHKLTREVKFNG